MSITRNIILVLLSLISTFLAAHGLPIVSGDEITLRQLLESEKFYPHPTMEPPTHRSKGNLNKFGLNLFTKIASTEQQNVVLSPASVASAMSMVAAGVTEGSQAEKELELVLGEGYSKPSETNDESVQLSVANSAWLKNQVLAEYKETVRTVFCADVFDIPTDPAVVNQWVETATNGEIKNLLDEIPQNAEALLINAVFFKASWTTKFDEKNTMDAPFYKDGGPEAGEVKKVKMMHLRKEMFKYAEVEVLGKPKQNIRIAEIPYGKNDEYAAVVVVPTGTLSASEVVESLAGEGVSQWDDWMTSLQLRKLDVLAMPRFRVEFGVASLKDAMRSLGINAPFDSTPRNPQFLRMSEATNMYLEDVLHKATIECTEEGTVASAATAAILARRSRPRPNPTVILDRPFLFAIRNKVSGELLFVAKINHPQSP